MGGANRGRPIGRGQVCLHAAHVGNGEFPGDGLGSEGQLVGIAAVQDDFGAGFGQSKGDGQPDAARRSGDQGFLAVQFDFHTVTPKMSGNRAMITQSAAMKNRLASDSVSILF
ncbi:hypothetical protein G6F65_019034 [Rhizopus arrhizus]|nr:hypothetical protein G6F65_019034 [Rhizopus arrhizus]